MIDVLNWAVEGNKVEYRPVIWQRRNGTFPGLYDITRQLWLAVFETTEEREKYVQEHKLIKI